MSGGSLNYAYREVEAIAMRVDEWASTPEQYAFVEHLWKVSKALKALEWGWSSDTDINDAKPLVLSCLTPTDGIGIAREKLADAVKTLQLVLGTLPPPVNMPRFSIGDEAYCVPMGMNTVIADLAQLPNGEWSYLMRNGKNEHWFAAAHYREPRHDQPPHSS